MKLTRTTPKFKGDFSLEISYLNSWPLQSPMWISFFWFKISLFSWQQIEGLCQKQKCCVKKGNVIRDMFRPGSLSGFPIDNTFSLLFVRFVEFSGKNCFHCVAMFHCRIFSITRLVVARYGLKYHVIEFIQYCFPFGLFGIFSWVCFFISTVTDWLIIFIFRRPISHSLVANSFPRLIKSWVIVCDCS